MTALGMRLQLSRLMRAHHIAIPPVTVTMAQPTARPQLLVGFAATLDVDLARQKFRPYAFGAVHRNTLPRLLYRHDPSREVGTINSLSYDAQGALLIRATVTCPLARRANAFSIAANVRDYELVNASTPDFYALIKQAELDEISLTTTPTNPRALVTHRLDTCARAELYEHAQEHIARLKQLVAIIQQEAQHD